jgi:hypothetical protein
MEGVIHLETKIHHNGCALGRFYILHVISLLNLTINDYENYIIKRSRVKHFEQIVNLKLDTLIIYEI